MLLLLPAKSRLTSGCVCLSVCLSWCNHFESGGISANSSACLAIQASDWLRGNDLKACACQSCLTVWQCSECTPHPRDVISILVLVRIRDTELYKEGYARQPHQLTCDVHLNISGNKIQELIVADRPKILLAVSLIVLANVTLHFEHCFTDSDDSMSLHERSNLLMVLSQFNTNTWCWNQIGRNVIIRSQNYILWRQYFSDGGEEASFCHPLCCEVGGTTWSMAATTLNCGLVGEFRV